MKKNIKQKIWDKPITFGMIVRFFGVLLLIIFFILSICFIGLLIYAMFLPSIEIDNYNKSKETCKKYIDSYAQLNDLKLKDCFPQEEWGTYKKNISCQCFFENDGILTKQINYIAHR